MINDTGVDNVLPDIVPSPRLPTPLQDLTNRARTYVEAASSVNTRKAYTADWKHFSAWCQRQNVALLPSDPRMRCRFDLDLDSRMDFDKIAA